MSERALVELAKYFSMLDIVGLLATYFITQNIKEAVDDKFRPFVAIFTGFAIAVLFAMALGSYRLIPLYGAVYGAGAIGLYKLGFQTILDKVREFVVKTIGKKS